MRVINQLSEYLASQGLLSVEERIKLRKMEFLPPLSVERKKGTFLKPIKEECNATTTEERIHSGKYMSEPRFVHEWFKKQNGLWCVKTPDIWMGDWDVRYPFETPNQEDLMVPVRKESITFNTKGEVIALLSKVCQSSLKNEVLRLYETFGGIRAFLTSRHLPVDCEWETIRGITGSMLHARLGCDPQYKQCCFQDNGYWCRVTPKQYRGKYDFVAKYLGKIGGGEEDPQIIEWIMWHDKLCAKYTKLA